MSHSLHTRWLAAALAGVIALGTMAPAAEAGRGRGKSKRYKDASCETRVVRQPHRSRVVVREHSHGGGQLGAFVGGLILGAVVSNAAASASDRSYDPPPRYRDDYRDDNRYDDSYARPANYYYDSYCGVRYDSFDACESHYSRSRHPQVIQVIEVRTGRTLDRCHYDEGRWRGGDGRYGADRRWEDDRYEDYRR